MRWWQAFLSPYNDTTYFLFVDTAGLSGGAKYPNDLSHGKCIFEVYFYMKKGSVHPKQMYYVWVDNGWLNFLHLTCSLLINFSRCFHLLLPLWCSLVTLLDHLFFSYSHLLCWVRSAGTMEIQCSWLIPPQKKVDQGQSGKLMRSNRTTIVLFRF